jgi:hypothetical protein
MMHMRFVTGLLTLCGALGLIGCASDDGVSPTSEVTREQLIAAMTPEAAAAIGSDGKLQLSDHPNTGRAQISGDMATALAVRLAKSYLPLDNKVFDGERGKPIDYQKLAVCGPILYAMSAFERLDMDDPSLQAIPLQKALGPFWLVTLCVPGGPPQLNIAVAAYSTDLSIDSSGEIVFPAIGGDDFLPEGIPAAHVADELPSPEAPVVLAANLTGRLVAAVPELIAPFFQDDSPLGSRWRIRLDGAVRLRTITGETVETSEIYISRNQATSVPGSRIWAVNPVQPADVSVIFVPQAHVGENIDDYLKRQAAETRTLLVARRVAVPISFRAAAIAP